jgi:hypothetical protein
LESAVALAQYVRSHAVVDLALHARFGTESDQPAFRACLRWAKTAGIDATANEVADRLRRVCPGCVRALRTPSSTYCTECRRRKRKRPPSVRDRARLPAQAGQRELHQRTVRDLRQTQVVLQLGKRKLA